MNPRRKLRARIHLVRQLLQTHAFPCYAGLCALFLAVLHGGALASGHASLVHQVGFVGSIVAAGLIFTVLRHAYQGAK